MTKNETEAKMTTTPAQIPDEFNLLRAPACAPDRKRHEWPNALVATCPHCGVRRMEVWGGKSPRASAGGMVRIRFAPRSEVR